MIDLVDHMMNHMISYAICNIFLRTVTRPFWSRFFLNICFNDESVSLKKKQLSFHVYKCVQVFVLIIIVSIVFATPVLLEDILPVFPPRIVSS